MIETRLKRSRFATSQRRFIAAPIGNVAYGLIERFSEDIERIAGLFEPEQPVGRQRARITDRSRQVESTVGIDRQPFARADHLEHSVHAAQIVVQGDVSSAPVRSALEQLKASLADQDAFGPPTQATSEDGQVVVLSVPVAGDADGSEATSAIRDLRAELIPQAFGELETTVLVGGTTAESVDYFDIVGNWLPIVFAFVLGLSFLLLTVAFRSIVIPAVAIALNLLSVAAAYGLLVLVFQKGLGNGLFGFQQVDTIEAWVPLFLFSVLFGLSMDYQVFLLSRIKERYSQKGDTAGSIAFGVSSPTTRET